MFPGTLLAHAALALVVITAPNTELHSGFWEGSGLGTHHAAARGCWNHSAHQNDLMGGTHTGQPLATVPSAGTLCRNHRGQSLLKVAALCFPLLLRSAYALVTGELFFSAG